MQYPEEEQPEIRHVEGLLFGINRFVQDFGAAASLFEFCRAHSSQLPAPWMLVAARDGAMSIYHFGKSLEAIRAGFGRCPTYRKAVEHTKLKQGSKDFEAAFPGFIKLRHAIAHNAELGETKEKAAANAAKGPFDQFGVNIGEGASIGIGNGLSNDTFFCSIDGTMVSYKINASSLKALINVKDTLDQAFAPAGFRPMPLFL